MLSTLDHRNIIHEVKKWNNLPIGVEYRPGDIRFKGTGHERKLDAGYGHLRGYQGSDKEALDVYLHPDMFKNPQGGSNKIFQVNQLDKEGQHDEHKLMLGWDSEDEAKQGYLNEMPDRFFGGIKEISLGDLGKYKKKNNNDPQEELQETPQIVSLGAMYAEATPETIQAQYDKLTPDKQAEFKQRVIYNIVDGNYGDRITDFVVDSTPQSGTVASGNFATPRLGGKKLIVDYVIKDSGVTLTPRNLNIIDHTEYQYFAALTMGFSFAESLGYIPLEFLSFGRTLQCEKGWACGGACLSKTKKNCHRTLNPEHKTYVGWLKSQIQKGVPLHKGHREEAEKLGLKKEEPPQPQPTSKTKTKKKSEPESKIKKGLTNKYAEKWSPAFNNSPQDLKDVLEVIDQPIKLRSPTGKNQLNAFYRRSDKGIAMGAWYEPGEKGDYVWRHEYGHHIDYEAEQIIGNKGSFGISSSARGVESIASDNEHLLKMHQESQEKNIQNFEKYKDIYPQIVKEYLQETLKRVPNDELIKTLPDKLKAEVGEYIKHADNINKIADPKIYKLASEKTEAIAKYANEYLANDKGLAGSIYRELPANAKEGNDAFLRLIKLKQEGLDPKSLASFVQKTFNFGQNINDLIGSITVNKVGQGHATSYYSDNPDHRRGTEAFANLNDLHGHGSEALQKVAEYFAPASYNFYKGVLKDVVKAKSANH